MVELYFNEIYRWLCTAINSNVYVVSNLLHDYYMSDLKTVSLFDTFVYQAELPEYLDNKDFMAACDEHTDKAIADA